MATGFTHKTREELQTLTAKEMDLVPRLVEIIFKHQGISNRISRRELEKIMILKGVGPERLTDMLRYIRLNDLVPCLVSYRRGYFVATSPLDISEYICRLDYKINDITAQVETLCRIKEQIMKQAKERFN